MCAFAASHGRHDEQESEMVEYVSGNGKFASFGAYSPLARVSAPQELVAVAGQLGADGDGNLPGKGDTAAQVRQAFRNVGTALEAAGLAGTS